MQSHKTFTTEWTKQMCMLQTVIDAVCNPGRSIFYPGCSMHIEIIYL
jgi:hypothetical protein